MSTVGKFASDLVKAFFIAIVTLAVSMAIGYAAIAIGQVVR